jgi:protein TonB
MDYAQTVSHRPNPPAVAMVVLIHGLLGWALISGFAFRAVERATSELKTFDVIEPAPPAEEPAAAEEEAQPTESEIVAPPSIVPSKASAAPMSAGEARVTLAGAATLRSGAFHNERDYPSAAKRAEEEGMVRVSYTIGLDGRVTNCIVTGSSGSRSLDTTTCRILERRFRYSPARDASGNPVSQTKTQSVSWRLT